MAGTAGTATGLDSSDFRWRRQGGVVLASRFLRRHRVPVVDTPLTDLPRLSRRAIGWALRLLPHFLDRADLEVPVIIAGSGWAQVALDGRHRISKATWSGATHLRAVRVPWRYSLELLTPGVFEAEWIYLAVRRRLRRTLRRARSLAGGVPDRVVRPPPPGSGP